MQHFQTALGPKSSALENQVKHRFKRVKVNLKGFYSLILFCWTMFLGAIAIADHCPAGLAPLVSGNKYQEFIFQAAEAIGNTRNYFQVACREANSIKGLMQKPSTKGLRIDVPLEDQSGLTTKDFLNLVLERARARQEIAQKMARQLSRCTAEKSELKMPTSSSECADANMWAKEILPKVIDIARFNLALASSSMELSKFDEVSDLRMNDQLKPMKVPKQKKWRPLDSNERALADIYFKKIRDEAVEDSVFLDSKLSKQQKSDLYRQAVLKQRYLFYQIYVSLMGTTPILQYIQNPNPSRDEIHQAAKNVLEENFKEEARLREADGAIQEIKVSAPTNRSPKGIKKMDPKALYILNYRTEVEEVLLEHPEYCGLGLALSEVKANQSTFTGIALLPLTAAAFAIPPLAGVVLGLGGAAFFISDTQSNFAEGQSRQLGRVKRDGMKELLENVWHEGKSSDDIRRDLMNDVTRVYRAEIQDQEQLDADRKIAAIVGPLGAISPLLVKYVGGLMKISQAKLK